MKKTFYEYIHSPSVNSIKHIFAIDLKKKNSSHFAPHTTFFVIAVDIAIYKQIKLN